MGSEYNFEDFRDSANDLYDEAYYVLLSKQRDYGPNNIRLSPFGEMQGLLTRINDKVQRAVHLISTGSDGENESLRDTFLDLMNYGAIGVMLIDDTFPPLTVAGATVEENTEPELLRAAQVGFEYCEDESCWVCAQIKNGSVKVY